MAWTIRLSKTRSDRRGKPASHRNRQRRLERQRWEELLLRRIDHSAEHLNVQPRRGTRRRLPLHAHGEPGVRREFDGLDHAIQRRPRYAKTHGEALNAGAVLAVDDDFAFAVDAAQDGPVLHVDRVAHAGFRWMAVLQGVGKLA